MVRCFAWQASAAKLSGFVQSAKDVPVMVAIDGCQVGCAKAILENPQVLMKHYLVITDEGIEKNKNFSLERSDIDCVKTAVKRVVSQSSPADGATSLVGCGCKSCC